MTHTSGHHGTGRRRTVEERPLAVAAECRRPLALVSAVGTEGGGCQRAIMDLKRRFGDEAELVCTHASGRPQHAIADGVRFVPPAEIEAYLADRACVVDEGTGQLGHMVPCRRRFIQSVRCANRPMEESIRNHADGPSVYTSFRLVDRFRKLLKPDDVVIPNGFAPLDTLPEKEPGLTVLHGRAVWQRAMAQLLEQNPRLGRVVVCGDGKELPELKTRFPHVEFAGFVDVGEYLARAEVNIHWSLYQAEGFWRGPAEGVAHGCGVICNRRGDVPYWAGRETVWLARSFGEVATGWRRLLTEREHLERLHAAGLRLAQFQNRREETLLRWEWLIRREMGQTAGLPGVLVGVVHGSGPDRRPHLDLCLQALSRQTIRPRVVVLNDRSAGLADPELAGWLREHHPWVELHEVWYDPSQGSNVSKVRNALWDIAGDEMVWCWMDGDVVLAADAVEQMAALITTSPAAAACCPRQRVRLGDLPPVLVDEMLRTSLEQVEEASKAKLRTRQVLGRKYAWWTPRTAYSMATGPLRAVHRDAAFQYNEAITGYGGDDNWWSCEAFLHRGLLPRLGPTAWHVEHGVQTLAEHGRDPGLSPELNGQRVLSEFGLTDVAHTSR